MSPPQYGCQSCREERLREIAGFPQLPRVTSDSKPFRPGGRLFVCGACGLVQKVPDPAWHAEIDEIYLHYDMYHQSAAVDQAVFDPLNGSPSGRCEVLVRRLFETGTLSRSGALLDVGAGSGAMLAAFSAASAGWKLYGMDLDDRKERVLRAIPRFEQLYTVRPEQLSRQFDLITLIHSLEHFSEPVSMLRRLRDKVAPQGRLFVEVVNLDKSPFDLVVADHLCHYTPRSLAFQVAESGFGIEVATTDWITKEISLLAGARAPSSAMENDDPQQVIEKTESYVAWLSGMLAHARESARGSRFGIFGTSVAATWLAGSMGDSVKFFVDEDPAREGRVHLGRPILKPIELARGAKVYLAFVQEISDGIRRRLSHLPVTFLAAP